MFPTMATTRRVTKISFFFLCSFLGLVDSLQGFSTQQQQQNQGYYGLSSSSREHHLQTRSFTTIMFSSTDDSSFMESLRSRVAEVQDRDNKMPLVVLDSMLPRQVLKIQVNNPLLMELVRDCLQNENPFFGMLGLARLRSGEQVHLKSGVEVKIGNPEFVVSDETSSGIRVELRAGRRFTIQGEVDNAGGGWTEARVKFLESKEEEEEEITKGKDRFSVARAISMAKEFTSPNLNMKDNKSLIDTWIDLAKENERAPGQIDELLEQLGEIPPVEEPSELAFWVGALINPLPALGVALEVRPALLTAKKAEQRVQVALDGILRSIKHMDGSAPLW
jgi:Lon protease-like protein